MLAKTKIAPSKMGQAQVLDLLKMIRPWTMRANQKVRVGNAYDGGYVLPAAILNCDAVVSVGVGHDVSFDLVLAQRGATILQYDHTVEGPPQAHENFRFHKLGWGTRTIGSFISFDDIHAQMQALNAKHPMLKFDIEGAEYEVLQATNADHLADYEIIACEVHDFDKLGDADFFASVHAAFEKLNQHHVPIHLHANNYQSFVLVEGVPIPKVLEVAFLRKDLDSFPNLSNEPIPGPLDRPNHPGRPDICMNPF
ncbi:MAG TPA: FkbM family methyltransferase [Rhizobacter sp.]|nr:FkbM family methyltransferase [Rhizobacter sp.]